MMRLSVEDVERLCPSCAEKMRFNGQKEIKFSSMKQMPPELLEGLCNDVNGGAMDGFFTACMNRSFDEFGPPTEEFCAWLHNECFGKWPAEKEDTMSTGVTIAVRPDSTTRAALAATDGVPTDEIHLTLCYLGHQDELSETDLAALPGVLARHVREVAPFEVTVDGQARWWADEDGWAHVAMVSDPTGELHALRDAAMSAAAFLGMTPRGKGVVDWRPHITLAYSEDPDATPEMRPEVPMELTVDRVAVMAGEDVTYVDLVPGPDEEVATMSEPAELAGPLVAKDDDRQVAYAPVLVPGEPDLDGDVLTAEKIEKVAHEWLERFRAHDVRHDMQAREGIRPVESWVMRSDEVVDLVHDGTKITLPKGTWCVGAKIEDSGLWAQVKSGELGGVSIAGFPRDKLESALKGDHVVTRTTLADLGDDWTVPLVSIVGRPAVPKAKWFALKATDSDKIGLSEKLKRVFRSDKEGMRFSEDVLERLRNAAEVINSLVSEAESERQDKKRYGSDDKKTKEQHSGSDEEDEMSEEAMKEIAQQVFEEGTQAIATEIEALKSHLGVDEGADDDSSELSSRVSELEEENAALREERDELKTTMKSVEDRLDSMERGVSGPRSQKSDEDEEAADEPAPQPVAKENRDAFGRRKRSRA